MSKTIESVNNDLFRSLGNSTTDPLGSNETFTGESMDVKEYVEITITITTNTPSATNGIVIQFSPDQSTWTSAISQSTILNNKTNMYNLSLSTHVGDRYFRILYTNGNSAQTFFHLHSFLKQYHNLELLSNPMNTLTITDKSNNFRLVSDYRKDVAMGLIEYNKSEIVNGIRDIGIGPTSTIVTSVTTANYNWPITARRLRIKAGGDANDTITGTGGRVIAIEGLDANYSEIVETLVTNGASESSWTVQTFIRVNSAAVVNSGSNEVNVGKIIIESETDGYELSAICPNHGRSLSSIYTVPAGWNAFITRIFFSCDKDHSIKISGMFRDANYGTKFIINTMHNFTGNIESKPQEYVRFDEKTDFWIEAQKIDGTGNADISTIYDVDLVKIN